MSTRTSTLLIASAVAAAAFTLGAQCADRNAGEQALQATDGDSAQSTEANSKVRKSAYTLDGNWWEEERARDDGYAWPLPSAARRMTSAADGAGDKR